MSNKVIAALGVGKQIRECNDYYATPPKVTQMLLNEENFNKKILEPACGEGHISKVLIDNGYKVESSDLINRNYGKTKNFFEYHYWEGDIITNPPYKKSQEFVEHALKIIPKGNKVAMLLKIQFLETKSRRKLFDKSPPKTVYISSSRIACPKNGDFKKYTGSAICFCWFIWEKGFFGDPIIKWFN